MSKSKKSKIDLKLNEDGIVEISNSNLLKFISGGKKKSGGGANIICAPNQKSCTQNAYCSPTPEEPTPGTGN